MSYFFAFWLDIQTTQLNHAENNSKPTLVRTIYLVSFSKWKTSAELTWIPKFKEIGPVFFNWQIVKNWSIVVTWSNVIRLENEMHHTVPMRAGASGSDGGVLVEPFVFRSKSRKTKKLPHLKNLICFYLQNYHVKRQDPRCPRPPCLVLSWREFCRATASRSLVRRDRPHAELNARRQADLSSYAAKQGNVELGTSAAQYFARFWLGEETQYFMLLTEQRGLPAILYCSRTWVQSPSPYAVENTVYVTVKLIFGAILVTKITIQFWCLACDWPTVQYMLARSDRSSTSDLSHGIWFRFRGQNSWNSLHGQEKVCRKQLRVVQVLSRSILIPRRYTSGHNSLTFKKGGP